MTARSISRSVASPFARSILSRIIGDIWTPALLFTQGQQGAWYEPKPQYLFQDSAGTTPVTADGQPVGYMEDLSGNGNHATQATAASKPIYRTDGTLHWLEFDGVDDRAQVPGTTTTWKFLHDGSDNFVQVVASGYGPSGLACQLVGTMRPADTNRLGACLSKDTDGIFRYEITRNVSTSYAARLSTSNAFTGSQIEEGYVESGAAHFLRSGIELGSQALTSPSSNDAAFDFTIGGSGFSSTDRPFLGNIYGIVVYKGTASRSASRGYLADISGVTL